MKQMLVFSRPVLQYSSFIAVFSNTTRRAALEIAIYRNKIELFPAQNTPDRAINETTD